MRYPNYLNTLIEALKKLPGVGQKSAERFAFKILDWPKNEIEAFAKNFELAANQIQHCSQCGALQNPSGCFFCDDDTRDPSLLCIVAQAKDIFAIEETHAYKGQYHVLGSLLSPMQELDDDLSFIQKLEERLKKSNFQELIIALDSTLAGDATTLYIKKMLPLDSYNVSRLAFGIPVGSSIDYIDGHTLSRAFQGRRGF